MDRDSRPKVIVVGAGIAGIGAARALYRHGGVDVVVLEASGRLGGRIHTEHYGDGVLEIGAQWIHGQGQNPVYQLARKHGLTVEEEEGEEWQQWEDTFYFQDGSSVHPDVVKDTCLAFDDISSEAERFAREKVPLRDTSLPVGTFARELFEDYLSGAADSTRVRAQKEALFQWRLSMEKTENGCPGLNDLSLYSWGEYMEFDGSEEVELSRGYQAIVDVLLREVPVDTFRLGTKVERIFWPADGLGRAAASSLPGDYPVQVQTASGKIYGADHVVVTCALGYLKKHAHALFEPALPAEKLGAIERIGYGTVNKIYLQFEVPFWDKDTTGIQLLWDHTRPFYLNCLDNKDATEDNQWFKGIHGFDVVERQTNLLCGWIAGKEAVDMEPIADDTVMRVCREILERFTLTKVPMPTKIIKSRWGENPEACGSYSYIRAGHTTADIDQLVAPLPDYKNPCVVFAGEATHKLYYSTTHGALISGEREAYRILHHTSHHHLASHI